MKNKILSFLVVLVICISSVIPAWAATDQYVFDPDEHLSVQDLNDLDYEGSVIESKYGIAVMFCITSEVPDDGNYESYCKSIYDTYSNTEDAIVMTHFTTDHAWSTYRCGDALTVFNDTVEQGLWNVYNENETYYGGIVEYFESAKSAISSAQFNANQPASGDGNEIVETPSAIEPTTEFVPVERTLPLLVDNADILSADEESALLEKLEAFTQEHEMEIAILTVNDLEGKSSKAYADDFYDYNGYGYGANDDGVLVLYKPGAEGERDIAVTTYGKAIDLYDDMVIDEILDTMVAYLEYDNYVDAFESYISICDDYANISVPIVWIPVCLVIGMLISWLCIKNKANKENKTDVAQLDASYYTREDSLVIVNGYDNFVTKRVDRIPIKTESSSNSSTNVSSSGRSHGGGSRKF